MHAHIVATLACEKKNCPTLRRRTDRNTYLVTGTPITDPQVLAQFGVPDNEGLVEIPAELLDRYVESLGA